MVRVLLAEDDSAMLDVVRRALSADGHAVTTAHDGQEALDLLSAAGAAFDVMLTDIHMPGMNGIELTGKAVAMMPKLRVLLMSASTDTAIPDALKPYVAEVLSKPLALDQVRSAVRSAIG